MLRSIFSLYIFCLVFIHFTFISAERLQNYNAQHDVTVIVIGLSAGGFMASQVHIAFSEFVKGVGILAGGPYYCAQNQVVTALGACMNTPSMISVGSLLDYTKLVSSLGYIDNIDNLSKSKVFLYSGSKDSVVHPGVVFAAESYYRNFVKSSDIQTEYSVPSEHAWITNNYGNSCGYQGSPWINNCNKKMSEIIMNFLLNETNSDLPAVSSDNLFSFDQGEFIFGGSFDTTGYVYVPQYCQMNKGCRLTIALHGCQQGVSYISDTFIKHIGLNEYADAHNLIILYPQVVSSMPGNLQGCFDWWGYSGPEYAVKSGIQMNAIKRMADRIRGVSSDKTCSCPYDMVNEGTYCIDKYEFPNKKNEYPLAMQNAIAAEEECWKVGKELCDETQWIDSCTSHSKHKYPYGDQYEYHTCNEDKVWIPVNWTALSHWPKQDAKDEAKRLYQGDPSGTRTDCYTEQEVFDMTGNVAEWVKRTLPHTHNYTHVVKGCYWSGCYGGTPPSCQFTNPAHPSGFRSYEMGFRCCLRC